MKSAQSRILLTAAISIIFFLTFTGIAPRADSRSGKSPGANQTAQGTEGQTPEPPLVVLPESGTPEQIERNRRRRDAVDPVAWAIRTATGVPVGETEIAHGVFARMEGEKYDAFTVVWRLAPGVDTDAVKLFRSPAAARMLISDPEIVGTNAKMSGGWLAPDDAGISALPATGRKNKADGDWTEIRAEVIVPFTAFSVTNTNDSGAGSLRQAIINANADVNSPHVITISATGTISLLSALPNIVQPMTINGPGANQLTVRRAATAAFSVFNISANTATTGFSGLTIRDGLTPTAFFDSFGGGIATSATLTINRCAVINNQAVTGGGGVITRTGSSGHVFVDSLFSGNTGNSQGGGIDVQTSSVTMVNCTVSGNTTTGSGGGVVQFSGSSSRLFNCTLADNSAGTAGSLFAFNSTAIYRNTIFSGSTNQVSGTSTTTLSSLGNNLCSDGTGNLNAAGDLPNTNALLSSLGSFGGPTQTYALLPGSPAINAGNNCVLTNSCPDNNFGFNLTADQRGIARAQQGTVDIGAFESRGFTMALSSGNNQSTLINTNFANPLAVTVSSANSEPVDGGRVTFTPPGSGASASVAGNPATLASGAATSGTVTANTLGGGPYTVAASARGVTTGVNFSLTNTCPPITAFLVTGGGNICAGNGAAVGLSGSQTGVNYQLFNGASPVGSPVAGTGSAISFGNQTTAGTYTVVGTFGATNCTANMTGSVVVTVNALPTAFNVTGGGGVCAGGPGVPVGLSGSQTGVNYQLFNGASPVGSPVAGTGSAISFGNQTAVGTYTVVATNTTTGCTSNMTGSAVVTTVSLVVTNGNDSGAGSLRQVIADACAGSTITFQAGVTTVTLTSGELSINQNLTIQGPGANQLTVTRGSVASDFRIFNVASNLTVTISGLTISNGRGMNGGGLQVVNNSNVTIDGCFITGNTALPVSGGGAGGGVAIFSSNVTFRGCTLSGNRAERRGGAIYFQPSTFSGGRTLSLTNCTLSGNQVSPTGVGGNAIQVESLGGTNGLDMTNCTIANNFGVDGSISTSSDSFRITTQLRNTLLVGNSGPSIVTAGVFVFVTSLGNNLASDNGGGFLTGPGDLINTNALLAPLANYGGATQTLALLPGSPAINAGTATGAPTADQRGISRVGNVDIGAFESRGFTMTLAGGNNQSAQIGANFANPLAVTVASAFGEPVDGGGVTFTSPGSGASASVAGNPATIASGTATTGTVTANGTPGGPYVVAASANGVATGVNFSLTNACPTITAFSVTGGGSFCAGGTGVAVGLSGSQIGVNYQLFNGASPVGSPVAGTGSALSFGNQTTAGTYTVVGTLGATGCTANMTGSAVVTVNPTPSIFNVTGGGSFCSGGTGVAVGLTGSQTGVNYQLFRGASPVGSPVAGTGSAISFGNQTTAGTYTVVGTNATAGCSTNMTGSAVVTVNPTPSIFNVTGGGSFCTGGTGVAVGLSGSQTGVNYQLFNGASPVGSPVAGTGSALNFGNQTTAGTYTVVATNGTTGCTSNMTGNAVVTVTTCQPTVTTNPATGVTSTGATLNGTVNANGDSTTVLFRYGTTAGGPYPNVIAATPSPVTGTTPTAVSAVLTGLATNQIYYFVVEGSNVSGTSQGAEQSFSTATCSFSLSASSASFPASGGNGSVTLTTTTGCAWTVSGLPDWIINVSPANGTGTTAITYTVNPNLSQNPRSATLTIGGQSYEVTQSPSVAVNSSIGLAVVSQTVNPTSCSPNYANDYVITATLTNTGSQAIYNPHLRVLELQEAAGSPAPPVPFRLITADGATCGTGGLVGSIQSTDGQTTPATLPTLAPGQSVTVRLVIALPSLRRFRFVFGVDGGFVAPVAMKDAKSKYAKTFTLARHAKPSTGTAFVFIPSADGKTMDIVPVQPELEAFLNLGDDFWADLNRTLTSQPHRANR
jgi:hypothetical protein